MRQKLTSKSKFNNSENLNLVWATIQHKPQSVLCESLFLVGGFTGFIVHYVIQCSVIRAVLPPCAHK